MAKNITGMGSQQVGIGQAILLQVNAALTGSIIVTVGGTALYGTVAQTIATITNPAVGNLFKYGGLGQQGIISVNPSASCDITVTVVEKIT